MTRVVNVVSDNAKVNQPVLMSLSLSQWNLPLSLESEFDFDWCVCRNWPELFIPKYLFWRKHGDLGRFSSKISISHWNFSFTAVWDYELFESVFIYGSFPRKIIPQLLRFISKVFFVMQLLRETASEAPSTFIIATSERFMNDSKVSSLYLSATICNRIINLVVFSQFSVFV